MKTEPNSVMYAAFPFSNDDPGGWFLAAILSIWKRMPAAPHCLLLISAPLWMCHYDVSEVMGSALD